MRPVDLTFEDGSEFDENTRRLQYNQLRQATFCNGFEATSQVNRSELRPVQLLLVPPCSEVTSKPRRNRRRPVYRRRVYNESGCTEHLLTIPTAGDTP